jgi:hypothetical protein
MCSFLYSLFLFLLITASPLPAFASTVLAPSSYLLIQPLFLILTIIAIVRTVVFCVRTHSFGSALKHSAISSIISLLITGFLFCYSVAGLCYFHYSNSIGSILLFYFCFLFLYPCILYLTDVRIGPKILKHRPIEKIRIDSSRANTISFFSVILFYILFYILVRLFFSESANRSYCPPGYSCPAFADPPSRGLSIFKTYLIGNER